MRTIGKYEDVTLEAPSSVAMQLDIIHLGTDNLPRALYAALGVCWRGRGRPSVSYARCGYNPAVYGGKVLQELVTRGDGTTIDQVVAAGGAALGKLNEAVGSLNGGDVKEAADFSEAPASSTTS
jgi:hypothetical protein